ncbi:hypothetical protein KIW84_046412 [Lathyrus oleraceus]|uniref:Uncharacterized protein n=1 Tax=Pisum sativum TaxID=3888 RepID=A0A9D5AYN4_PEA|nr:hypothetical protein KIW84_046412 [Pisum sativum]
MSAQNDQKLKQEQISQKNNNQEGRRPRYDPIPMSYAHLLPILVNAGEIVPKQIKPAKFTYHRQSARAHESEVVVLHTCDC